MKTTKPLIVHTESSCGWGGQEIRILSEMQGMQARGYKLHLLCVPDSPIFHEAQKRGINVTGLAISRKNLQGLNALRQWLKRHSVNLINTHSSTDSWLAALARIGLGRKIPIVRTRHISAKIAPSVATRWLYKNGCEFVVTTGEQLRHYVLQQTGLMPERVRSIPTGIDTTRFIPGDKVAVRQRLGLPIDKPIIGIVATIRTWKGHVYLVEALAQLKHPEFKLLIVGDGPNKANVEKAIVEQQLDKQVIFAGQQANVVPWLQAMDIFVLPSYANEGVPQSLMQAMLCGVPVISTPVGSIGELIQSGETGLLVEPKNPQALSAIIAQLLQDETLRITLAQRARTRAQITCSLETMVTHMEEVVNKLTG